MRRVMTSDATKAPSALVVSARPIVNSVGDALKSFLTTNMDALCIGGCAVTRSDQVSADLARFVTR